MSKFTGLALVRVSHFNRAGSEADKNGVANTIMTVIAGSVPNKALVTAGTVAASSGLNIGETLLVNISEREPSPEYGRQFSVIALGKPTMVEIITMTRELGNGVVFNADAEIAQEVPDPSTIEATK